MGSAPSAPRLSVSLIARSWRADPCFLAHSRSFSETVAGACRPHDSTTSVCREASPELMSSVKSGTDFALWARASMMSVRHSASSPSASALSANAGRWANS